MLILFVLGGIVVVIVSIVFCRQIVRIISNENYAELSYLLPWLVGAQVIYFTGEMVTSYGVLVNRLQIYLFPKIASTLIVAVLSLWLPNTDGPIGVVYALGIAGLVYTIWTCAISIKIFSSV
jgi:O-antigen/teichoic acid export membrane protein